MDKLRIFYDDGTHVDVVPPKQWTPCEDEHCVICNPLDDKDLYPASIGEAERILSEAGFDISAFQNKMASIYWRIVRDEDPQ